jgi:Protein of unknown function (DUF2889)
MRWLHCSQLFRCAAACRFGDRADVLPSSDPMPLPPSPNPRQRLHERRILYEGYLRDDGMFDIEAHLIDAKDHDYELLTGMRPAREAVHDMWVRVTIDREFFISAIDVCTDGMPYPGACDRIEPEYVKLVGANLAHGFRKRLHDDMGGIRGCTHVTELLAGLPTAAMQTFASLQREDIADGKPFQLDHCHALATTTDTVRRYYPKWYRGTHSQSTQEPA